MFGPILHWEMLVLPRRLRYFAVRVGYLLLVLFMLWFSHTWNDDKFRIDANPIKAANEFGEFFFRLFSVTQLAVVVLLTPAFFATSISIDRERKTMDYLLTSTLTNTEIVLGRWSARLLNLLLLIVASMPLLGFVTLIGSISPERLIAVTAVCVVTCLSLSAWSTLISVYSRTARTAVLRAYGLLFVVALVAPAIWISTAIAKAIMLRNPAFDLIDFREQIEIFERWAFDRTHPIGIMRELLFEGYTGTGVDLLYYLAIHTGLTVIPLVWAIVRIRRRHLNERSEGVVHRPFQRAGKSSAVGDRPMIWREWRFGSKPRTGVISVLVGLLFSIAVLLGPSVAVRYFSQFGESTAWLTDVKILQTMNLIVMLLVSLRTAIHAAGTFGLERDRDCITSLLTTPMTATEIVVGKIIGSMRLSLTYSAFLFLSMAICALQFDDRFFHTRISSLPLAWACNVVPTLLLASIGVAQSIRFKTMTGSIGMTLFIGLLFFGLGHLILALFAVFMSFGSLGGGELIGKYMICSLPWVLFFGSIYGKEIDLPVSSNSSFDTVSTVLAVLATMLFFAWMFAASTIGGFCEFTGRTEDEIPRFPTPDRETGREKAFKSREAESSGSGSTSTADGVAASNTVSAVAF